MADGRGGDEFRYSRVGVGEDRGGHVQHPAVVDASRPGRAVEQQLQMAPALPVEHAHDEADGRVEGAGEQGRGHVRPVVGVAEGKRGGPLHTGRPQRLFVRATGHMQLDG